MDPVKKIMIIDDEVDLCLLMRNYLVHRQYEVRYATTLRDGMSLLNEYRPGILFLDNNLPDGIGWDKIGEILEQHPGIRIYLMSGYQPNLPESIPSEAYSIIQKPISFRDLDFLCNDKQEQKK